MDENKVARCDLVVGTVRFVHLLTLLYIVREQRIQDRCLVQLVLQTNLLILEMIGIQETEAHIQKEHMNKGEITDEKIKESIQK